jgi:hypothetical protein
MITKFKIFEKLGKDETQLFNIGDWVKFYDIADDEWFYGEIEDITIINDNLVGLRYYYQIKIFGSNYYGNNIQSHFIIKLTKEEKKDIKFKNNINKYNL